MALFNSDANLRSAGALVEEALRGLGHDVEDTRVEPGRLWLVPAVHASVTIRLGQREGRNVLRVWTPVLVDAPETPELFRELLEMNAGTVYGAAFALEGTDVIALAERATDDLDRSEVEDLVRRVTECGDLHGPRLIGRHGGQLP